MYTFLLFDLDNTLLDYGKSEKESMKGAMDECGLSAKAGFDWDTFWQTYLKQSSYFWERRVALRLGGLDVLKHALSATFNEIFTDKTIDEAAVQQLVNAYWERFCTSCYYEEGSPELIQWAKSHYKLGIVSNGIGEAQRRRLKSAGMYKAFDSLIFSDEAGVYKPDPRIFQMAIKQLGARPEQVLYIGDSLHDDYQGAKNAGIDFCWYNPKGLDAGDASPLHIIHRLSELKAWLRA